ncbi:MAG: cyclic nucleotide-binding domain-containing protein [Verrucomicrobiae bacterium]|nr:cyclic nucleotide-binding domain-containing protein [Verrucomicrobiae bacterium]
MSAVIGKRSYFQTFCLMACPRGPCTRVFLSAGCSLNRWRLTLISRPALRGAVDVTMNGEVIAYRVAGNMIGEMSFISGEPALATVRTIEQTRYIMWLQEDLRKLLQDDVSMQTAMQTIFNKDLIHKLVPKTEAVSKPLREAGGPVNSTG